ncbi:MAG: SymE family type I addiction module toxin [Agriterribacter sp.]
MSKENDICAMRTLKVYYKIFWREKAALVHLPEIRLMGKWLADCGFRPGQHIEVLQAKNKLIITPAWFEPDGDAD